MISHYKRMLKTGWPRATTAISCRLKQWLKATILCQQRPSLFCPLLHTAVAATTKDDVVTHGDVSLFNQCKASSLSSTATATNTKGRMCIWCEQQEADI